MKAGIIFGISGGVHPYGTQYHEDIRFMLEIAPADRSALLSHTDEIRFLNGRTGTGGAVRSYLSPRELQRVGDPTNWRLTTPSRCPNSRI